MKRKKIIEIESIVGGGAKCDFTVGVMAGATIGLCLLGVASGGTALAIGAYFLGLYCTN